MILYLLSGGGRWYNVVSNDVMITSLLRSDVVI